MRRRWWTRGSVGLVAALLFLMGAAGAEELGGTAGEAQSAAARARAAGKTQEAVQHLLVALGEHPHAPSLLLDLVETTKADADARALWSHALVAALSDGRGRFKLPKGADALVDAKDDALKTVATARSKAVHALAQAAAKLRGPGSFVLATAYEQLARSLTRAAPGLWQAHAAAFEKAVGKTRPSIKAVVQAMRKSAGALAGPDPAGARLELGRALRGLAAQARSRAPGADAGAEAALENLADTMIREATAELAAEQMEPLTLVELRAMDEAAIAAFNRKHANIRRPGRALTESGRYLVVTPCGHGTLLAATEIADPTHDRLARWFGVDPFKKDDARGEIRVFPTFADLEAEATPYFWANGFQRGALTVVRCAAEREIELARLLSHELMHRFDRLLHPGLPSWIVEGRGVWAGGAFAHPMGGDFVENFVDGGRVSDAGPGLYGNRHWLEEFMRGDGDDYRDNYTAGHALWVYLYTWKNLGRPLYRPRLEAYLTAAGTGTKKPIELFAAHFADGRGGRPKGMAAFAAAFGTFLRGWRSEPEPTWFDDYVDRLGDDGASPYILDKRAWHLERRREQPVFGQDHPARAAAVLAESGDVRAAIGLLEWSLAVDDFEPDHARLLIRLLEQDERAEAAAALRVRIGEPAASFLDEKHAVLDLVRALDKAAEDYAEQGLPYAAHVFRGRRRALEERLGAAETPDRARDKAPTNEYHAPCGPALQHAETTWVEEALSDDYDKWREKDAWRETPEGHLIVGRAAEGTAGAGGVAGSPYTFVRSDRRLDGAYTLSGRIALLSPHCQGAIVLGWSRRDRNVRIEFDAGGWAQEDRPLAADEDLSDVSWHVTGLRYRDRALSRAETFATTRLTKARNEFAYRIDVDGDVLDVFIDGRRIATFAEGSGQPIAGFSGFALRHGAIRVEEPRVRFHRAWADAPCEHGFPFGHDPLAPKRDVDKWILGRRILGAPRSERGTLLLWYPLPFLDPSAKDLADKMHDARMQMSTAASAARKSGCTPAFAVYVPRKWPAAAREAFAKLGAEELGKDVRIRYHYEGMGAAADVAPDTYGYMTYVLFQDPNGVTRHMGRGAVDTEDEDLAAWMRLFRAW